MKKTINRVYEFTVDDVRLAILEFMRTRDYPAPDNIDSTSDFSVTERGVVLEWTEIEPPK